MDVLIIAPCQEYMLFYSKAHNLLAERWKGTRLHCMFLRVQMLSSSSLFLLVTDPIVVRYFHENCSREGVPLSSGSRDLPNVAR